MEPSRIRAFVFDMDGTLVDSVPGIQSALAEAFRSIGRTMPAADLRRAIGPPIRVIAKRIEPTLTDAETLAIEQVYRPLYDNEAWRKTVLFEGVAETLQTLHAAGCRLLIVTNKPHIPALKILDLLGVSGLFEAVFTRDSATPHYASKAAMLGDLIATHGVQHDAAVMVGDTIEDREAAEANGIQFIFASYGYGDDPHAEHVIASFAELVQA
jgi:phosphoglycolate phosphatase